ALVRKGVGLARENITREKGIAGTRIANSEFLELSGDFLLRTGHRGEAMSLYRELLLSYEEMVNQSPHDPNLLYPLARYLAMTGDLYSGFNAASQSISTSNRANLLEARRCYQKSLEAFAKQREELGAPEPADQATADAFFYRENQANIEAVAAKLA